MNSGLLDLLVGLVGVNHELEAANSVGDGDRGVRPRRIGAHLAVGMAERIVGEVDDEPARRRGGALERHAHQPPRRAAAAVAADDVARGDRIGLAGDADRTPSRGLLARLHRATPAPPRRSRSGPGPAAAPRRPSAGRSRCAWASRIAHRAAPSRPAAAACRRRTAGSGWARCAAARARPGRSTGTFAAPRRRVRRRGVVDQGVPLVDHERPDALQPKDVGQGEAHRARAPTIRTSSVALPSAPQQEVEVQGVERLGVLVLRPVPAAGHDLEPRAGDHRGDAAALADVGGRVVAGPQHQGRAR